MHIHVKERGYQMKTLIVRYTPSKKSKTKTLLDAFRQEIAHSEIEELDLCSNVPDLFSVDALEAYFARVDGDVPFDSPVPELSKMDHMTAQLMSADVVVIAFPMHNFSLPATVKAWFDSVMLYGQTFKRHPRGGYLGS